MQQEISITIKKKKVLTEVRKVTEYFGVHQGQYQRLSLFPAQEEIFNKFYQEACRRLDGILSEHTALSAVMGGKYTTDNSEVKDYEVGLSLPDNYPSLLAQAIPSMCATYLIDYVIASWIGLSDLAAAQTFQATAEADGMRISAMLNRREPATGKRPISTDGETSQITT